MTITLTPLVRIGRWTAHSPSYVQQHVFSFIDQAIAEGLLRDASTTSFERWRSCHYATPQQVYRLYLRTALAQGLPEAQLAGSKTFSQALATRYPRVRSGGIRYLGLALSEPTSGPEESTQQ